MAVGTLSPRLTIRPPRPRSGGGSRPPVDRYRGGGGGGGRGGDNGPDYGERLRRYRLGMAIGLVSVVMLFVTFSLTYVLREAVRFYDPSTGADVRLWTPVALPLRILWINTAVLVLSSVTLEMARRRAVRDSVLAPAFSIPGIKADDGWRVPWLAITVVLGFLFVGGQLLAWQKLEHGGFLLGDGAASTFFYVLTGTHALHLVGGLLALLYVAFITWRRKPIEQRRIVIDVASWYWHVIDILWIYLFALLAFAR
jgi:cytochrome c oxidase subunit 3